MAVAVDLDLEDRGNQGIGIIGRADLNLTALDATTAAVFVAGRPLGRIRNRTNAAITVTFLELEDVDGEPYDGTGLNLYDEDVVVVGAKTIPAWSSMQIPNGASGADWLVIKLSTGTGAASLIVFR